MRVSECREFTLGQRSSLPAMELFEIFQLCLTGSVVDSLADINISVYVNLHSDDPEAV